MNHDYYTITEVFDFGPHVSRVILDMGRSLKGITAEPDAFRVFVKRTTMEGKDFEWPAFMGVKREVPLEGTRKVTALYPSDRDGNPCEDGTFLTLELYCDPREDLGSIIRFDGEHNVFLKFAYTITQVKPVHLADEDLEGLVFDRDGGNRVIYGEWLQEGRFEHPDTPLSYVYYEPETKPEEKVPLLIWLHGAGEGGADTPIAAIGNKVVNLISPQMQVYFGKALLLAPQCPTMWMDNGSGEYTTTGISMYTEGLEALIDDFVKAHPSIDTARIYLGGCSNGGFMTMRMLLRNPGRYAAAYPVCEAMYDKALSDEDIRTLAGIPIWFVHAKNDPVVAPADYVVPTYQRILAARAADVHFTFYDRVLDPSGKYVDEKGEPYEYMGHWTWVPMLNNRCTTDFDGSPVLVDGKPVTILEWLASHRKAE
ncbi:MAG: hypothetical protein SOZ59_04640 [Candidatus Limivivens sp.]|nr:hypothetical protein [Candidatus Limivivens sp.]